MARLEKFRCLFDTDYPIRDYEDISLQDIS